MIDQLPAILKFLETLTKAIPKSDVLRLKEYILHVESANTLLGKENSELIKENERLKEKISKHNNWNEQKGNYDSHKTATGTTVYRNKNTLKFACPRCFEVDFIIVHVQPSYSKNTVCFCPSCKTDYFIYSSELQA